MGIVSGVSPHIATTTTARNKKGLLTEHDPFNHSLIGTRLREYTRIIHIILCMSVCLKMRSPNKWMGFLIAQMKPSLLGILGPQFGDEPTIWVKCGKAKKPSLKLTAFRLWKLDGWNTGFLFGIIYVYCIYIYFFFGRTRTGVPFLYGHPDGSLLLAGFLVARSDLSDDGLGWLIVSRLSGCFFSRGAKIHDVDSFSHNHGSGKWPFWRLNSSSRALFSTSMIVGGRVHKRTSWVNLESCPNNLEHEHL